MRGLIIGFGNMGKTHYERYSDLGIRVDVVDVDETKLQDAKSVGLKGYKSLSEFPDFQKIDFFDICTPTHLHYKHIIEAAKYHKPIIVEKPIVRTLREANKLRNKSDLPLLFVAEVEHYNPALSRFLNYKGHPRLIEISREINLDFFLEGTMAWVLIEALSGGIVFDAMIHDINLIVSKYGKPKIRNVTARSIKRSYIDEVVVDLSFKNLEARLHCTWSSDDKDKPVKTSIRIHEINGNLINISCDSYIIRDKPKEEDAFHHEIKAFISAIKSGKTPYLLESYLDAIEVAHKINKRLIANK